MADKANVEEVMIQLQGIVDGFDFTVVGRDQSLGRDIVNVMVGRIEARCAEAKAPDGTPWPENKEPYRTQKEKKYGWTDSGKRTGQTTSVPSLRGSGTTIEADVVTMRYGTDQPPDSTAGGSPTRLVSKGDGKRTDTQKAEYMHTGGRWNTKRPFYEVGQGDAEAVTEVCQDALNEYITRQT